MAIDQRETAELQAIEAALERHCRWQLRGMHGLRRRHPAARLHRQPDDDALHRLPGAGRAQQQRGPADALKQVLGPVLRPVQSPGDTA